MRKTIINILGVKQGKWTQNLLTTAKALGGIIISIEPLMHDPTASDLW